jgi:RNA polymerase sigma-70 factor, ECF subfamily
LIDEDCVDLGGERCSGDTSDTSLSLITRVQVNDQAAWVRLVDLYGPMVHRWCLQAGLQPADAADVGQEVFRTVSRSIGTFSRDRPGDSFRGWLFTITRNKIRDHSRKTIEVGVGGSDPEINLDLIAAHDPNTEPPDDSEDQRTLYLRAVEIVRGEFEPKTWEAFWRVVVDDRAAADVAEELGISRNAVYLAKSRVAQRLRVEFEGLIDL